MMKPMFSYFGSKYKLAKHYGAPKFDTVIEPFAGSAAYSLYHEPRNVILADKNPIICSIWRYLINVHEHEILSLPVHFESVNDLKIPEEAKQLIGFWIGIGCVRPSLTKTPWGKQYVDSKHCRVWGHAAKIRIAIQLKKIRHWKIIEKCYSDLENQKAHWFIDPPYEIQGKKYPFKNLNYEHLSDWCNERSGFIQVCESKGASWLPFSDFRTVNTYKNLKTGIAKRSNEVLYERLSE